MTSAVSRLVYMPNFRAIGQSVWEKNGNRQTHRNTHRNTHTHTDLNFIKIDRIGISRNVPSERSYFKKGFSVSQPLHCYLTKK